MALTQYEDLLPYIQPQVPAAPIAIILSTLRRVVSDFCLRSTAYRYRLTGIPAIANVPYYDLPTPSYTAPAGIVLATYQGAPLRPTSDVLAAQGFPSTSPHSFIFESGQVRIIGTPTVTIQGAFEFLLYLRPTMAATGVNSAFIDEYYHEIASGVLSELLLMSNQPWSNPQLGSQFAIQYNLGVDNAKSRANADHTAKVRTTRINWF